MYHSPIQLDVFPTDVQMRRIDPARNMRRFYRLSVQRDLFCHASLVREWGRIGFRGQMMIETHSDEGKAITALMKLAAVKKRRGYAACTQAISLDRIDCDDYTPLRRISWQALPSGTLTMT